MEKGVKVLKVRYRKEKGKRRKLIRKAKDSMSGIVKKPQRMRNYISVT